MSEDKRNDAASGKDAAKDKTAASAAKTGPDKKPESGKASAPATDPKPAKAEGRSGTGKAKPAATSADGQSGSNTANKSAAPGKTSTASGASATAGAGSTSSRAGTAQATGPATTASSRSASGSGGGRTPHRSASTSSGHGGGGAANIIAIVAVVIALLAIVMSGWVLYRGQGQLGSVDSRLDTVEKSMQSNVQDVVMPRVKRLDSRVESLDGNVKQQSQTLSSLQESLQQTQSRTAELADQLTGNKTRWDLNQIEALLQAANERLQLYNDPQGARQALSLASDAIARKGDPRLFKLRGEIVNEIAALDALPDPDVEGMSLALGAMIEQVPDLPLASNVPGEYENADDASAPSGDAAQDDSGSSIEDFKAQFTQGWDHFTDSVGSALSGMLTIRRSDGTQRALLPPDQSFFLSQNLQLELRSARLALLERDTQNYRDSLASARQWLEDYYDTNAAPVSKMQERIGQMSNVKLDWNAPDISGGLTMLRQMMAERGGSDGAAQSGNDGSQAQKDSGQDSDQDNSNAGEQAGEGDQ